MLNHEGDKAEEKILHIIDGEERLSELSPDMLSQPWTHTHLPVPVVETSTHLRPWLVRFHFLKPKEILMDRSLLGNQFSLPRPS